MIPSTILLLLLQLYIDMVKPLPTNNNSSHAAKTKIWSSTYTTLVLSASSCNMQVICWIFASLKHNTLMNVAFCKQLWLLFPRFLVHIRGGDHTSAAKWNHKLAFTWLSTLEIRKARDIKCDYVLGLQFQYLQHRSRIKFIAACVSSVL